MRPRVDHALRRKSVRYELRGSSPTELRYEVTVPFNKRLGKLTRIIRGLDKGEDTSVDWSTKKPKALQT
jgi:hypothetical protein